MHEVVTEGADPGPTEVGDEGQVRSEEEHEERPEPIVALEVEGHRRAAEDDAFGAQDHARQAPLREARF